MSRRGVVMIPRPGLGRRAQGLGRRAQGRARGGVLALALLVAALVAACSSGSTQLLNMPSKAASSAPTPTATGLTSAASAPGHTRAAGTSPSPTSPTAAPPKGNTSAGTTSAGHAPTAAAVDTAMHSLAAQLPAGGVSVAALNLSTGASYQYGATGGMFTGSIVKLDILETLLLQHQDKGTLLTDSDVATAQRMIENSDNTAADELYNEIGGSPALSASNPRLGLKHTVPGPPGYWGLTRTNASDFIALLHNLLTPKPLDPGGRSLVLGFMRAVEPDQRWGVGVVADPHTTFANKNGWLQVDDDNPDGLGDHGLWLVNSTGIVTVHGQQVLMAVLTQHNQTFNGGVTLVQELAKALVPAIVK